MHSPQFISIEKMIEQKQYDQARRALGRFENDPQALRLLAEINHRQFGWPVQGGLDQGRQRVVPDANPKMNQAITATHNRLLYGAIVGGGVIMLILLWLGAMLVLDEAHLIGGKVILILVALLLLGGWGQSKVKSL